MKIVYLTHSPQPGQPELDAHFQELELLRSHFAGEIISAFPFQRPNSRIPHWLYGIRNRKEIMNAVRVADIIHVFSASYRPYSYLKRIKGKPLIYSILTPTQQVAKINSISRFIVSDPSSLDALRSNQDVNVSLAPTFVNFESEILPPHKGPFTLMMASAPWEASQFKSKGIHLLLSLLERIPDLHLILIWRSHLSSQMKDLLHRSPHQNRVTLINKKVEIKEYLQCASAVVLLASHHAIVKSYPHSLIEGILSGRPVLTSRPIPMSMDVQKNGWGEVIDTFDVDTCETAVRRLTDNYENYVKNLHTVDANRFSKNRFITFFEEIYRITLNVH